MSEQTATIIQFPERSDPSEYGGIADINAPMASVEIMGGVTDLDIPPDRVLNGAVGKLKSVLLLGWDKDDTLYVATSQGGRAGEWIISDLANRFLHKLYNGDFCL